MSKDKLNEEMIPATNCIPVNFVVDGDTLSSIKQPNEWTIEIPDGIKTIDGFIDWQFYAPINRNDRLSLLTTIIFPASLEELKRPLFSYIPAQTITFEFKGSIEPIIFNAMDNEYYADMIQQKLFAGKEDKKEEVLKKILCKLLGVYTTRVVFVFDKDVDWSQITYQSIDIGGEEAEG